MPASVLCPNPNCSISFSVEQDLIGTTGRCPHCGTEFALSERASGSDSETRTQPWSGSPAVAFPDRIGRYSLLSKLGEGGMGVVYLAHDAQLDRRVALKIPHAPLRDADVVLQRFLREARTAASFVHPNFCPVYDAGQADGWYYLAMAFIDGQTLAAILERDGALPQPRAAAIARKLAIALQEAHDHGITHRDLKPANVMINRRRELIIMDFGLARREAVDEPELTRSGVVLGSVHYMAPEQVRGERDAIGPATDVYALGVILYQMLTGRRPFEGAMSLVLGLIAVSEPDPPSKPRPDLDPALEAIVVKAIAKDPAKRFASMTEFADALGNFLNVNRAPTTGFSRAATSPRGPLPAVDEIELVPLPDLDQEDTARPSAKSPYEDEEDDGASSYNLVDAAAQADRENQQTRDADPESTEFDEGDLDRAVFHPTRSSFKPAEPTLEHEADGPAGEDEVDPWQEAYGEVAEREGFFRALGRSWHWIFSLLVIIGGGGGFAWWLITDQGTIRVVLADPESVVLIDGQEIAAERIKDQIPLRTGYHHVLITKQLQVIEQRKIKVSRGARLVLTTRASRPPPPPNKPDPPRPAD